MLSLYRLQNKLPNEKILKVIRNYIFLLIQKVAMFLFLIILPLIFFYLILFPNAGFMGSELAYPLIILGTSIYYLFIWIFFFFSFIDYYLDVWIITNERIIDIEQRGFFSRIISEHKLFRIQDVNSEVHGIFPTLFRFGEVHVQTAGAVPKFQFHQIPYPEKIRDTVIKLAQRKRKEMRQQE